MNVKKIVIPAMIVAILASTSSFAFAATTTQATNTAATSAVSQGNISFAKETRFNPNGSVSSVTETWADPKTNDKRIDMLEPVNGTATLRSIGGAYVLKNGAEYIKTTTDAQGNITGILMNGRSSQFTNTMVCTKQEYVNEYKAGTRRAGWTDEGTVKAANGTELNKISRTDADIMSVSTFITNVYLDKNSGLPVKSDCSQKKNGATSLLYTSTYAFSNVSNDGSLFSTSGMNLKDTSAE